MSDMATMWPRSFPGKILPLKPLLKDSAELTPDKLTKDGFHHPILKNFGPMYPNDLNIDRIGELVGDDVVVPVIDVEKQEQDHIGWNMKRWVEYFKTTPREKIYNVLSLEYSSLRLNEYVFPPESALALDVVERFWPTAVRESRESPAVERYLLMSAENSFTDFHIDFGGSSVWYHPMQGRKLFLLIEPTAENLRRYRDWNNMHHATDRDQLFTGVTAYLLDLRAGQTVLLPAGWIHAVYTPVDSIVFGGNFIHALSLRMSLIVNNIEEVTRTDAKFRFPFFVRTLWFIAAAWSSVDPLSLPPFEQESYLYLAHELAGLSLKLTRLTSAVGLPAAPSLIAARLITNACTLPLYASSPHLHPQMQGALRKLKANASNEDAVSAAAAAADASSAIKTEPAETAPMTSTAGSAKLTQWCDGVCGRTMVPESNIDSLLFYYDEQADLRKRAEAMAREATEAAKPEPVVELPTMPLSGRYSERRLLMQVLKVSAQEAQMTQKRQQGADLPSSADRKRKVNS